MNEYIKREHAVDAVLDVYYNMSDIDLSGEKFEAAILKIPAADVAPVVHGHFIHDGPRFVGGVDWWHCSNCGKLASGIEIFFDYCPFCGAKMDEKEDS